jgi:hypothetical protein|nr:MAG TPA: YopX protein [Caudoviricetes sp.]
MKVENIKFKAKKTLDGKWIKGDLVHHKDSDNVWITDYENQLTSPVNPSTVCQFTGLTDCVGKEIWEGDIIRNPEFPFEKRAVTWSNNNSCFMPIDEDGYQDRDFSFLVLFKKWTVVGNKFDNEK